MSTMRSNVVILDRAYDDGKLAGFLGLETIEACPYGGDQPGPRIAWLDGFAYGAWKGTSKIDAASRTRRIARPDWRVLTGLTSTS
jgi:hypothetical protein